MPLDFASAKLPPVEVSLHLPSHSFPHIEAKLNGLISHLRCVLKVRLPRILFVARPSCCEQ